MLEAAARVFAQKGYGQTPVEDIIVEAGVSRGAFYHHFSGKEELFKALLDDHLEGEMVEFGNVGQVSSFRDLIERFVSYQLAHLESDLKSGAISREFFAAAARDEEIRRPLAEYHRRLRSFLAEVIRSGQRGGHVRADLDVKAAAFLLQALFDGSALLLTIEPDASERKSLARPWAELIERFVGGASETKPTNPLRRQERSQGGSP